MVFRRFKRLEIGRDDKLTLGGLANLRQFALGKVAAQYRPYCRADQRIENESGPLEADFLNDPAHVNITQRHIALAGNVPSGRLYHVAGDAAGLSAPDIVGANEIAIGPEPRQDVIEQRDDMLVGAGSQIDRPLMCLKTLIGAWVPERWYRSFRVA